MSKKDQMDKLDKSPDNNNDNQPEAAQKSTRYPRAIAFIIGNEFCERFSYYGAKGIRSWM